VNVLMTNQTGIRGLVMVVCASLILPLLSVQSKSESGTIPIRARTIENFKVGSNHKRFGSLEFVGGLELVSSSNSLGAMSSIRVSADRQHFLGVMDTGFWYAGRIIRDNQGVPTGIDDFSVGPILGAAGTGGNEKWLVDAESLDIRGGDVFVGFERDHRIDVYPAENPAESRPVRSIPILIPKRELRSNRGLEMISAAPVDGPLKGALVAVSEKSLNAAGNIFAAVLEGPRKGIFYVKRQPPFDVTDGDFLPNGDLLLLERRFSIASGVGMRIRRIKGDDIKPGQTVDGEVLIDTDFGYQIDNMEGLDVTIGADGNTYLTLISDDNHSILQRNLLLEFRLVD